MPYILNINDKSPIEHIGVKAFNLALLKKYGFNVPRAYFISVDGLIDFLSENKLNGLLLTLRNSMQKEININACNENAHRLRQAISNGMIQDSLIKEIETKILTYYQKNLVNVAIRSSSINEDLNQHSFAGLYNTVLNVPLVLSALEQNIKNVWASQWSDAIISYNYKHGLTTPEPAMGVIIQEMVDAEIAGVLFSHNPNNFSKDEMIIEYVTGLGETLVSGEKTPLHLIYQRKDKKIKNAENVVNKKHENILSSLIDSAINLEKKTTIPVDLEWAYANNELYLLQMRSITAFNQQVTVWTDENVGEVIPDVVTPYSWSILSEIANSAFKNFLYSVKVKDFSQSVLFCLYKGKVYFNSTAFQGTLEKFYLSTYTKSLKLKKDGSRNLKNILKLPFNLMRIMISFLHFSKKLPDRINEHIKIHKRVLKNNTYQNENDYKQSYQFKKNLLDLHKTTLFYHVSDTILAELFYQFLSKICMKWLYKSTKITADQLLIGLDAAESAKSGFALWEISNIIRDLNLQDIFKEKDNNALEEKLAQSQEGQVILEELNKFIKIFGHQALHEFELLYPRWWEDKNYIYSNIRSYLMNDNVDLLTKKQELTKQRDINVRNALHVLKGFKKYIFKYFYKKTVLFSIQRENLKQIFMKTHSEIKKHLLNIGVYFTSKSIINNVEDILFLENKEINSLIKTNLPFKNIKIEIQQRKALRAEFCNEKHPGKVIQVGESWQPFFDDDKKTPNELSGIGCSSGNAEGSVRIIENLSEFDFFNQGDILITKSLNPAWTPLFVLASAVVTEIGGALSHGAIIAREYGIPMITAVKDITSIIATNDRIRVNGDTGQITILTKKSHTTVKSALLSNLNE